MVNLNPSQSERRKHPRVKFHEKITAHNVVESKSGNVYEVSDNPQTIQALNISEGGIRLELGTIHEPSTIVKLTLSFKEKSLDVYSKLVWTAKGLCGLQFMVLEEEVRKAIRALVENKTKE